MIYLYILFLTEKVSYFFTNFLFLLVFSDSTTISYFLFIFSDSTTISYFLFIFSDSISILILRIFPQKFTFEESISSTFFSFFNRAHQSGQPFCFLKAFKYNLQNYCKWYRKQHTCKSKHEIPVEKSKKQESRR